MKLIAKLVVLEVVVVYMVVVVVIIIIIIIVKLTEGKKIGKNVKLKAEQ
jgi:hypothetical protein